MLAPRILFATLMACSLYAQAIDDEPISPVSASWKKLTNPTPGGAQAETMLLLTDGTIMIENGTGPNWLRLTPDANGSYINHLDQ